jgi:uncharacterized protein YjiS (DUF1127 family)
MCILLREWRRYRRYRATLRDLRSLAPERLSELGIPPAEIDRLAREAADAGHAAPAAPNEESPAIGMVPMWSQSSS